MYYCKWLQRCQSGRMCWSRKPVYRKVSRVQIPLSAPNTCVRKALPSFFVINKKTSACWNSNKFETLISVGALVRSGCYKVYMKLMQKIHEFVDFYISNSESVCSCFDSQWCFLKSFLYWFNKFSFMLNFSWNVL